MHPLTVELARVGDETARAVLAILDAIEDGVYPPGSLPDLAAVLMRLGARQAAELVLADYAATVAPVAGVVPPSSALVPVSAVAEQRAAGAVATVLAGPPEQVRTRLERLTRSAVVRAGQDTRAQAVARDPNVKGWRRGLDSDACQLCRWWWRSGRVWPKDHHMPRHPGCSCVQVPVVVSTGVKGVSKEAYEDSVARRELDRRGKYLDAFGTDRRHTSR